MLNASILALPVTVILAAISAGIAVPALADATTSLLHRVQTRARLSGEIQRSGADKSSLPSLLLTDLCRNGIRVLRPVSSRLVQIGLINKRCESVSRALLTTQLSCDARIICELLLLGLVLSFLFGALFSGSIVVGIGVALASFWLVLARASKQIQLWEERFRTQIPDALRSIGVCFSAGFSLQQALEQTAMDVADPLGWEFAQVNADIHAGRSLEEALSALEQRTNVAELRFVSVALEIQHQTGGSLQQILDNAAASIRASLDLRRSLAVQTAQARMSAKVVTLMPLVLMLLLSLMMEGYLQSFFASAAGLLVLVTALAMEALGILAIRRILGLKLN